MKSAINYTTNPLNNPKSSKYQCLKLFIALHTIMRYLFYETDDIPYSTLNNVTYYKEHRIKETLSKTQPHLLFCLIYSINVLPIPKSVERIIVDCELIGAHLTDGKECELLGEYQQHCLLSRN